MNLARETGHLIDQDSLIRLGGIRVAKAMG